MAETSNGNSSAVPIVAIIAIGALVLFMAWFFLIRGGTAPAPVQTQSAPPPPAKSDSDINIKVDLPDSVVIK
jgi:flagellar basal body-associated protein FliL